MGAWLAQSVQHETPDLGVVSLIPTSNIQITLKKIRCWGTWVAQLVKRPTLAQFMISLSVSSSPASGSVLTAQNLDPASDSVSPSLSDPPTFMLCLSLSQK